MMPKETTQAEVRLTDRPMHCNILMIRAGKTQHCKNPSQLWQCKTCGLKTTFKPVGRPSKGLTIDMKAYQRNYHLNRKSLQLYKNEYLEKS